MSTPTAPDALVASLMSSLGQDFSVPAVNLADSKFQLPSQAGYTSVNAVNITDLTDGGVDGTGAFDKIMASHKAHLKDQFDQGLLTGSEYTRAYIALTELAMNAALQMILVAEQTRWQTALVQQQARTAEIEAVRAAVELETAKHQLAAQQAQANVLEAQDVLTRMQIATEDAKYKLTHEQIHLTEEQKEAARAQTRDTLSDGVTAVGGIIAKQKDVVTEQITLTREQMEAARAQTMDTRSNGTTAIAGSVGKQKDLYTQQITSYQRDAEQKVGKMFLDGWITQKTLDEGLAAPTQLTNTEINEVLVAVRTAHGLGS